ncbi:General secretion pathway protein E [Thioalkalivibrio nitratireducens DSM 14787]|uniref:Type II secretion system protein E n=1 Tax=Thioalkalivibrio nitratireducens (strain DSM 14787 / UNIQEM 213 / ALEN2) TaxID=1255043 RepID=L0DX91_THIND|nr:General secretion pathway protein E [Thioalkalivibrio nitratireducens DSM 14787]
MGEAVLDLDIPDEELAAWLVTQGRLRTADLERSRRLAQSEGLALAAVLLRLGVVGDRDLADALAALTGVAIVRAEDSPDLLEPPADLPERFLREVRAVPLGEEDGRLVLALADPRDRFVLDSVALAAGQEVTPRIALPADITTLLDRLAHQSLAPDAADAVYDDEVREEDIEHLRDMASEAPVIRLVNAILQQAVDARASDIHIEPFEGSLKVRLRIDGILHEIDAPPARSSAAVISRVKIMARLNIAERRLPQDGRIKIRILGKELDLRVSTVPTLYGESVVLRLLDKESVVLDFETLGFEGDALARFLDVLNLPHGIILVTGPTGSGKSTSLYTALSRLNTAERKIITVEDPVEYQLDGVNQIQVKPQIGLTFATALRSIVRQDPDIIMVGEMRDLETAQIAVQSALTGHLVLSTLHTNDAAASISRLLDMGVEEYLLTSTVNGILAQRLVRRLCPDCREPVHLVPELVAETGLERFAPPEGLQVYQAVGCPACAHTGFRGRLAITEFLVMSDPIRSLVMRQAPAGDIAKQAREEGMRTLYEDGLTKVARGLTTLDEILRVTES